MSANRDRDFDKQLKSATSHAFARAIDGPLQPQNFVPVVEAYRAAQLQNNVTGLSGLAAVTNYMNGRRSFLQTQYRSADPAAFAITSNEAFDLAELPKRIVVVGGGYIAVEFANIFHGLGVETTLVYRGAEILSRFGEGQPRVVAQPFPNARFEPAANEVLVFDGTAQTQIATLRTYNTPTQLAVTFDRRWLMIGHDNSQLIRVYDLETLEESLPIRMPPGHYPRSIAATGRSILVASRVAGPEHKISKVDFVSRTASEHICERRFSGAGRPHNRQIFIRVDIERHIAQCMHLFTTHFIDPCDVFDIDNRCVHKFL